MGMNIEHGTGLSWPLEKWGCVRGIFRNALNRLHKKGHSLGLGDPSILHLIGQEFGAPCEKRMRHP